MTQQSKRGIEGLLTPDEVRQFLSLPPRKFGDGDVAGWIPVKSPDAPKTVTCARCGDSVPSDSDYCTSIADCQNLTIRSRWIIPGDGK